MSEACSCGIVHSVSHQAEREFIELEMTYTPTIANCKDPAITPTGDMRHCRRMTRHTGDHASGFGKHFYHWSTT